jgi:hypothetical protein
MHSIRCVSRRRKTRTQLKRLHSTCVRMKQAVSQLTQQTRSLTDMRIRLSNVLIAFKHGAMMYEMA